MRGTSLKKKIVLTVLIIGIFTILMSVALCRKMNLKTESIGHLKNPKICSTVLALDDKNIIIFGGYNKNGSTNEVEVYNTYNNIYKKIYKSNFNNSYQNFAFITKNKTNEKLLINIQPVQFEKTSEYGVEVYNFNTKKLSKLNIPIKKRGQKDKFYYLKDSNNIYIIDDTNFIESINYKNFIYKKIETKYPKQVIYENIFFGGIKDNKPQKEIYANYNITYDDIYKYKNLKQDQPHKLQFELPVAVESAEIYLLKHGVWREDSDEYIVVDKKNKSIQAVFPYYQMAKELNSIKEITKAAITNIIQIDDRTLLFVFEKNNTKYFVTHTSNAAELKLELVGKIKNNYKGQKYLYLSNKKMLQLGGIKSHTNFKCGDNFNEDIIEISDEINKIYVK